MGAGCNHDTEIPDDRPEIRRVLLIVIAINAAMFVVEVVASLQSGSLALLSDSLDFAGDAGFVAHNAPFDRGFINMELARLKRPAIADDRFRDTVALARKKFPGSPASLDALCKRFGIDNSSRTYHGALLDAQLLANVYLELIGGREPALMLGLDDAGASAGGERKRQPQRPAPLAPRLTAEEEEAHRAFIAEMGEKALWRRL